MNTRTLGTQKEQIAKTYLEQRGMEILEMNYRIDRGEIDLIGMQEHCLVFVEVKYRSTQRKGSALEAVTPAKQRQICKVADYYRYAHSYTGEMSVRYDVVAIQGEEITWVKNAFPHSGRYL